MEKFLITCWKNDPIRGEANFDIEDEKINIMQTNLFTGDTEKPKKVDQFESELEEKILSKEICNNADIYIFTIERGFIQKHARKVIQKLYSENKILDKNMALSHRVTNSKSKIKNIELVK